MIEIKIKRQGLFKSYITYVVNNREFSNLTDAEAYNKSQRIEFQTSLSASLYDYYFGEGAAKKLLDAKVNKRSVRKAAWEKKR